MLKNRFHLCKKINLLFLPINLSWAKHSIS